MYYSNSVNLYQVVDSIFEDFDSFFSQAFKPKNLMSGDVSNYPLFNLYVDKETKATVIELAATGFNEDEIDVRRDGNYLIIEAKSKKEDDETNRKYIARKVPKRDFKRVFSVSDKIDWDKIDISFKNGLLEIVLNLKDEEKPVQKTFKISQK